MERKGKKKKKRKKKVGAASPTLRERPLPYGMEKRTGPLGLFPFRDLFRYVSRRDFVWESTAIKCVDTHGVCLKDWISIAFPPNKNNSGQLSISRKVVFISLTWNATYSLLPGPPPPSYLFPRSAPDRWTLDKYVRFIRSSSGSPEIPSKDT